MKQELVDIISKKYSDNSLLAEILNFASKLIDALQELTPQTEAKFLSLLKKYNFDTINEFSEYPQYPSVTLFKGVDDWTLCPVIDYEGGVTDMDQKIGFIFTDPEIYPDNDDLFEIGYELKEKIILTWLSKIWFNIKGDSFGIVVKTLENNSASGFYFNDLAWDNLSDFRNYNNKEKRIESFFTSPLDWLSIYQRVSLITYPVYPYLNKWRLFNKAGEIIEFVSYGNETLEISSDSSVQEIKEHKTLFDTLKYEQTRTLELIELGYTEYLPEGKITKTIYEGAIETEFHSGEHWYYKEQENRLSLESLLDFEKEYDLQLPFHFKHYLRLFNGRKYNNINMYFGTGGHFLKVATFYSLEEIKQSINDEPNNSLIQWLDIGVLEKDGKKLSLNLATSKLAIKENNNSYNELDIDFETFIRKPRNH